MAEPGAASDSLLAIVKEVDRYATAGQQIIDAVRACKLPLEILAALGEEDKELLPELTVAANSLSNVVDVLTRAHDYLLARRDTRLEAIANNIGLPEEGNPT